MPAHNGTDTPTDIQVGPPPPSAQLVEQFEQELKEASIGVAVTAVGAVALAALGALDTGDLLLGLAFLVTMGGVAYTFWNLKQMQQLLQPYRQVERVALEGIPNELDPERDRQQASLGLISSALLGAVGGPGAGGGNGALTPCGFQGLWHKHTVNPGQTIPCPAKVSKGQWVSFYEPNAPEPFISVEAPHDTNDVHLLEIKFAGFTKPFIYFA